MDAEISRCPRPSKPDSPPPEDAAAARNKSDDPELDGAGEPYAAQAMHSTIATELTNMTGEVRRYILGGSGRKTLKNVKLEKFLQFY